MLLVKQKQPPISRNSLLKKKNINKPCSTIISTLQDTLPRRGMKERESTSNYAKPVSQGKEYKRELVAEVGGKYHTKSSDHQQTLL